MNASTIIKLLPMLIMLVSLSYAACTVQWLGSTLEPILTQVTTKQATAKVGGTALTSSPREEEPSRAISVSMRDPFQVVAKPAQGLAVGPAIDQPGPAEDSMVQAVQGMTLNATLIQGRTQVAIINGRIYYAGQHLEDRDGQRSALSLTRVFAKKVVLEAGDKHYVLAYSNDLDPPDAARDVRRASRDPTALQRLDPRLALIQALLKSPLAGLGASDIDAQQGGVGAGKSQRSAVPARRAWPAPGRSSSSSGIDH